MKLVGYVDVRSWQMLKNGAFAEEVTTSEELKERTFNFYVEVYLWMRIDEFMVTIGSRTFAVTIQLITLRWDWMGEAVVIGTKLIPTWMR